jgi:hypothetical protein
MFQLSFSVKSDVNSFNNADPGFLSNNLIPHILPGFKIVSYFLVSISPIKKNESAQNVFDNGKTIRLLLDPTKSELHKRKKKRGMKKCKKNERTRDCDHSS